MAMALHRGLDTEDFRMISEQPLPWEKLRDASVLVTGGNGLIASAFVDALLQCEAAQRVNVSVTVLCRSREKAEMRFGAYMENPRFHLLLQDVCEPLPENEKFQYILHAASPSHPLAFSKTPVDVLKANFLGTMQMLESARQNNSRMLYISSGEVYGANPEDMDAMPETYPGMVASMQPRACYPEGKRAAEALCASYGQQYGVDAVAARLCYVYGASITEDNSRADAQFLRNALKGEDIVMKSAGTQLRTYCYLADCISGLLFILLCGQSGEAYNIANRDSVVTIRQYAQVLADVAGVSLCFENPSDQEKAGYSASGRSVLDGSKLEKLGWKPVWTIQDGLQKTFWLSQEK